MLRSLVLLLLLALPGQAATVISIGDGDTLRVRDGGRKVTIRLACIDAPETAQSPFGMAARRQLASLAPVGSEVSLRVVDTDRYGRSVAELFKGRQNVNLQMVRRGQAFAYRQYLRNCDATAYLGAERGAEVDRLGVWTTPGGIQRPWDFRHGRRGYRPAPPRAAGRRSPSPPTPAATAVVRLAPLNVPRSCCVRATAIWIATGMGWLVRACGGEPHS